MRKAMKNRTTKVNKTKSREDKRQNAREKKIAEESIKLIDMIYKMQKIMRDKKFARLPDIDKHIFMLEYNTIKSYLLVLNLKYEWESVRINTQSGEHLNREIIPFWNFTNGLGKNRSRPASKKRKTVKK